MKKHKPPSQIAGTPVTTSMTREPLLLHGEEWVTMWPLDPDVARLWEFSLTTGRILQTDGPR